MPDISMQSICAAAAVLLSVGTLTFNGIKEDATTTTSHSTRLDAIETQISAVPSLADRIAKLETDTAVTNRILIDLEGAVTELSGSTKALTKVVTTVAVLDEKVDTLEAQIGATNEFHKRSSK